MFRTDFTERQFLEMFLRLVVAVETLIPVPPNSPNLQRVKTFDDVKSLLRQGRKIEAIKLMREMTGSGLKDAKDVVDALEL